MLLSGTHPPRHENRRRTADEADLSLHAFCYTYDERGRCTELKKPGTGTIRYGYGNNDLMLFSQDEKQQAANLMTFYLYDKMHRLVVKGECEIPLNFAGAEQAIKLCRRRTGNHLYIYRTGDGH